MRNCMEWVLAEHAIFTLGGATVPLYDTLGPDTVSFVLGQTNLSTCVCSRAELPCLVEAKKSGDFPNFQCIILVDGVTPEATQQCDEVNLQVISLSTIETHGVRIQDVNPAYQFHSPPSADDIATFCYTSGTTGDPKGALCTHKNFITTMAAISKILEPDVTDRHMSYLPLPHIFERLSLILVLCFGGSVGFFRGDTTLLIEDLVACRPTTLPAAPRVLNKIYDKIMAGINNAGGMKKKIFFAALAAKAEGLKRGKLTHGLYDAILFNKIKKALGLDCVRILVSGSAPLSAHVMTFFRCMLGGKYYGSSDIFLYPLLNTIWNELIINVHLSLHHFVLCTVNNFFKKCRWWKVMVKQKGLQQRLSARLMTCRVLAMLGVQYLVLKFV